ncbi:unnamed protein product [Hydatigera taeniaeformis]|uniref:PH domain-containing protein n=1 Tax=Hydatigena taeniaeformis TaxID=6205 RepID=A0A158RE55_HYDTA|nr:unnamed protein product [Hydatigera taeniaeformis]
MIAIKEGPLFWALDKDATVVQRTYGVLYPQLLLIYSNEDESSFKRTKPLKFFNLQQCLAVQPADQYPDFYGIMLMIVPGGVSLLGCSSEIERREWMEVMNEAMDADVISTELRDLIDTILGCQKVPHTDASKDGEVGSSGDSFNNSDLPTISPQLPHVVQLIMQKPSEEATTFSCPPLSLIDSPQPDSPIQASPIKDTDYCCNGCLNEVAEILSEVHPTLFNSRNEEHLQPKQQIQKVHQLEKGVSNDHAKDLPKIRAKPISETESMIDNFRSLSKVLISQEAVTSVLGDNCSILKETLKLLRDRLRLRGIEVELSFLQASTPSDRQHSKGGSSLQDIPNALKSWRSADGPSVIRRRGHQVRRPGQTASLVMSEDQSLLCSSPDTLSTGTSSTQTLVASTPIDGPAYNDSHSVDVVCSHCLKILSAGILEISMNLITSETSPSPQTMRRVCALASCLHSYLSGHIAAIRNRTNLPDDVLITGLAKLALNDPNAPPMVQALVESVAAEVCGQILDEIGDGKMNDTNSTHIVNGLVMDWFNAIPEKPDLKWMLPGYIATCLMLYRLSDSGVNIIKNYEKLLEPSLTNGSSHDIHIQDVLEALSITLNRSVCQEKDGNPPQNESYLQLGVEFESVFFELLMRKYDKHALEIILPEAVSPRNVNPDRKQSSLSPDVNNALNELEGLSNHLLKSRRAFYERIQNNEDVRGSLQANQEVEDYANVISALQREHEEEKQRLLQDVKQNWFHRDYYDAYTVESELHLKSLHSQLNRLCAATMSSKDHAKDLESAAAKLAKAQKLIRDSHVVLLHQVENAINVFSKFVNSAVDRQEGLEDNDFNDLSARVPDALAGLAAAVNDLRARLYCDVDDDDDLIDVDADGEEDDEVKDFPGNFETSDGRVRKLGPSPLGFTINLQDSEDPDEISESEI